MPFIGGLYQLDQVTLVDVKAHLSTLEGVYFEPLSGRFASISIRRRVFLLQVSAPNQFWDRVRNAFKLIIDYKRGKKVSILVEVTDIGRTLMAIIGRIYKFKTIAVRDCTEQLMESLLAAAVEFGLTDVRRFELFANEFPSISSVAAWINQISPTLRHLVIRQWRYRSPDADTDRLQHAAMLAAVGHCQRLRSVAVRGVGCLLAMSDNGGWLEVLEALCARPTLRALGVAAAVIFVAPALLPSLRFELDLLSLREWLTAATRAAIDLSSLKHFLARIDHFVYQIMSGAAFPRLFNLDVARVEQIVAWLRPSSTVAPLPLVSVHEYRPASPPPALTWPPTVLNNWLLIAGRCRAVIKIFCRPEFALPTVQQYAAIKAAIEAANIHGLMPLPATPDPLQMTFGFFNGAKVVLL